MGEYIASRVKDFAYNFSAGQAYLTPSGLSSSQEGVFTFSYPAPITAIGIILSSPSLPQEGAQINAQCYDSNGRLLPGDAKVVDESRFYPTQVKSVYTFSTPLAAGTAISFGASTSSINNITQYDLCMATIFS
jgi:hypothetical protein